MKNILELGMNEVIHCSTPEENEAILKLVHSIGWKWCNGNSYLDPGEQEYYKYKEDTCYYFHDGTYGKKKYYEEEGYIIYKATEFINVEPNYEIY